VLSSVAVERNCSAPSLSWSVPSLAKGMS
jgi:hypothetical protein